jgi:hypothetical protein
MPTIRFSINVPLQFLAGADIQAADHEEQHHDGDIDKVSHNIFPWLNIHEGLGFG